jgi:peptidyl-tRNA hydrolase (EC 3.1.1.29)
MYIIVGLGNPGREYEGTRHNMGFDVIDNLSAKLNIDVKN